MAEYFGEHMAAHAKVMGLSDEAYRAELKRWYNGYRFSPDKAVTVYNLVSTGLTAIDCEKGVTVREGAFDVSDLRNLPAAGMLYQTGYLTIKDYEDGDYTLNVPDEEVRRDLMLLVAAQAAEADVQSGRLDSPSTRRPASSLMRKPSVSRKDDSIKSIKPKFK